jgi:hypothetical protein
VFILLNICKNRFQFCYIYVYIIIIIVIIVIQPLGRSGQRPELSQATGMALVRCILGKFLGVVCHCFPPHIYIYIIKCFLKFLNSN